MSAPDTVPAPPWWEEGRADECPGNLFGPLGSRASRLVEENPGASPFPLADVIAQDARFAVVPMDVIDAAVLAAQQPVRFEARASSPSLISPPVP